MKTMLSFLCVLSSFMTFAQNQFILMSGKVVVNENNRPFNGTLIKVYNEEKLYSVDTTTSGGKFSDIKLPLGSTYTLIIEKEGYVSKLATIDATYDESFPPVEEIPLKFEVTLFESCEFSNYDFLKTDPVVIFQLDNSGYMTFDREQIKYMMKKVEQARYAMLKTEERDTFITNYDHALALMRADKFSDALPLLVKAKEIVDCPHVLQKLKDCKRELKIQTAYNAHISDGDKFYAAGDFELASSAYKTASLLCPEENYPNQQILEIEYTKAIIQADQYYDVKDYQAALKYFDLAARLKPDDTSFEEKHTICRQKVK